MMKLVALTLVRNGAWSIGPAIRSALRWCDCAVVLNHASTDGTGDILSGLKTQYRERIEVLEETDPVWHEMRHRQRTLEAARKLGGTHFAIIDADEMLTETLAGSIRAAVDSLGPLAVLQVPWICCWRSLRQMRRDASIWSRSWVTMAFRDEPGLHWDTRTMGGVDGYDFHSRAPAGALPQPERFGAGQGGLLHFQHANWERLRWKQVLYRMVELLRWPEFGVEAINRRYRATSDEDGIQLVDIPQAWIPGELAQVDVAAEPWEKFEVRRLVSEHGLARFAGLDFLGVELQ